MKAWVGGGGGLCDATRHSKLHRNAILPDADVCRKGLRTHLLDWTGMAFSILYKDKNTSTHQTTGKHRNSRVHVDRLLTKEWMDELIITYLNNNVSHVISFLRMKKMFELNFVQASVTVLVSDCPTSLVTWLHSPGSKQDRFKCCIFQPALGHCTLQSVVKICFFHVFCTKM